MGRSIHNIRIERLWRDVRRDCLEIFCQIFFSLEDALLLNMEICLHQIALCLCFGPRIQRSLGEMKTAWNAHSLHGEQNQSPNLSWSISKTEAITCGTWPDPGDPIHIATSSLYGVDDEDDISPPIQEIDEDPNNVQAEVDNGIQVNTDAELHEAQKLLADFDFNRDDGNWGIDVYIDAVRRLAEVYPRGRSEA